jgi:hypothetical protein
VEAEDDKKNMVFGGLPKYLLIEIFSGDLMEEGTFLDEASTRINFRVYFTS